MEIYYYLLAVLKLWGSVVSYLPQENVIVIRSGGNSEPIFSNIKKLASLEGVIWLSLIHI